MAGLLDSFFNPATFGGQNASLLDFLRQSQMQQQNYVPSAGFDQSNSMDNAAWPIGPVGAPSAAPAGPTAIGGYQMPRIGTMAQFTPPPEDPAALPVNAQPAQGQLPAAAPRENGFFSFLNRVNDNFQNMGNGGSLIGAVTGQSPTNQTMQYLVKNGIDPALARNIAGDTSLLRAVLPSLLGTGGQTDDIKEYQFAKREDPTLTFEKFMSRKRANNGEYGLNYVYGTDAKGNTVAFAPGKDGIPKQVQFPEGTSIARGIETIQTPTEVITRDKQSGVILSREKKDIAGAAKAKEVGEAEGQALVNLPTTIATAETALKTIKQLEEHPGKKSWGAFGWGALFPDAPGSATRGFGALVDQVKGQNFMTAFQSLKGAGAITEQEGAKAEKAQARLDRAQSEADFNVALNDLKEVITAGMERARNKAGIKGAPVATSTSAAPATNLKAKYGLD